LGLGVIDQRVPSHCSISVFETVSKGRPPLALLEPTATHLVVLAHDTPLRSEFGSAVGFGLPTIDQAVPFQCSASVLPVPVRKFWLSPTATQSLVLAHATPLRSEFGRAVGFGLATIDQLDPFQCSTSVCAASPFAVWALPTAKQLSVLGQATSFRNEAGWVASGLGTIDHRDPSQCSTRVCAAVTSLFSASPTEKQLVVVGHDTPTRNAPGRPVGFGLGMIDQPVPFQCSASVVAGDGPESSEFAAEPTATQLVGLGHDTPSSAMSGSAFGFGLRMTDQPDPSQCSTNVFASMNGPVVLPFLPTAKQSLGLGHDTSNNNDAGRAFGFWVVMIDHTEPVLVADATFPSPPPINQTDTTTMTADHRRERGDQRGRTCRSGRTMPSLPFAHGPKTRSSQA